MKCPQMLEATNYPDGQVRMKPLDCLKEKCARWDDKFQQCLDITSTEQLLRIANALNAILDKMPHELQFRK